MCEVVSYCASIFDRSDLGDFPYHLVFDEIDRRIFEDCCDCHQIFIIDAYLVKLFEWIGKNSNNLSVLLNSFRTLNRVLKILRNATLVLTEETENVVNEFVLQYRNYAVEAVRHCCMDVFDGLLSLYKFRCSKFQEEGNCRWFRTIKELLFDFSSATRSNFRCLLLYLQHFGHLKHCNMTEKALKQLYGLLDNSSLAVSISEIICFDLSKNMWCQSRRDFHINLLTSILISDRQELRYSAHLRLFPALQRDSQLAQWIAFDFIPKFTVHSTTSDFAIESQILLAKLCLRNERLSSVRDWKAFVDEDVVVKALLHTNEQLRLSAWDLISEQRKLTEPIEKDEIRLYKMFIVTSLSEQNPAARERILSGFKRVLIRIREVAHCIHKTGTMNDVLISYRDFVVWISKLCFASLQRDANFNRHIMALCIITHIFKKKLLWEPNKEKFFHSILPMISPNISMVQRLIECLDDSFEICQNIALDLLVSCDFCTDMDMEEFLEDTKSLLISIRSVNSIASGYRLRYYIHSCPTRFHEVMNFLFGMMKTRITFVKEGLTAVINKDTQLHPILNAFDAVIANENGEIWSETELLWWKVMIADEIIPLCVEISRLVSPIVYSMSPEGHNGEGMYNTENHLEIEFINDQRSQILLVNCWRTQKHVSSIFHSLISKHIFQSLLSLDHIFRIRDYFWSQLTECKHFGAIETSVKGFESLCTYIWKIERDKWQNHVICESEIWLNNIMQSVRSETESRKLCLTRRSAGLPYLVCSILATEPIGRYSASLNATLDLLVDIVNCSADSQVHSLNILRAIFRDCRFSKPTISRAEKSLVLCFSLFQSFHWIVRNSVSQLFAVLMERIFGVNHAVKRSCYITSKNWLSSRDFFSRYPSIYAQIYRHLSVNHRAQPQYSVFGVLTILTHLRHSCDTELYPLSNFILPILKFSLDCAGENLRQLAATALYSISAFEDMQFILDWIKSIDFKREHSQNQVHTVFLLLNLFSQDEEFDSIRSQAKSVISTILSCRSCNLWCCYNQAFIVNLASLTGLILDRSILEILVGNDRILDQRVGLFVWNILKDCPSKRYEFKSTMLSNQHLRFEIWQRISQSMFKIHVDSEYFDMMISDLNVADDRVLMCILEILNKAMLEGHHSELKGKLGFFGSWLLRKDIRCKLVRDFANLLNFMLTSSADYKVLLDFATNESTENRLLALEAINHLLKMKEYNVGEIFKIVLLLIQDENRDIREKMAKCISGYLCLPSLAPSVILWMIAEKFPPFFSHVQYNHLRDDGRLFDAISSNTYKENCLIGNDFLDEILMRLNIKKVDLYRSLS